MSMVSVLTVVVFVVVVMVGEVGRGYCVGGGRVRDACGGWWFGLWRWCQRLW